jgi:hypothetical protein
VRAAGALIAVAAGLLLVYEVVALAHPDYWTISRWVAENTETVRGASWLSLLGLLSGHFVMGMRSDPWTNKLHLVIFLLLTYILWEVVGGLTDFPTPAKTVYKYLRPGGETVLAIPFLWGFGLGRFWTRGLTKNE